ncbi:phosphatidylserine decarboxylase-domain-containing protein [Radiomyces spectabilis]|uniref:phosphatidylserine decarboxylase-domain-containing protein n=1 Tax=Radiomyces spectabilis TaxID=64574 RepID=UPI002220EDBC|nr:phosphatidylserine decarboxylase-domain-containing protein [Radiomyces spectabilis]KAI8371780.1 phosphatidylserine decarboxylase-domain-containing protein [Radiomyces spectabilis]
MTVDEIPLSTHEEVEHHIENDNTDGLMNSLSKTVDESLQGKTVNGGIHTPSAPKHWYQRKLLRGWLHTHLFPENIKTAIEKRYGNFVVLRETGEYHYEEMPIYTRIGMHLLFVGHYRQKMVDSHLMHKLFLHESRRQGTFFIDPISVKQIEPFIDHYNIDMSQYCIQDINAYTNFNEFFTRAIKPEARPIADAENPDVLISAADCRLNVFHTVDAAAEFWIKGKEFNLPNLLQDEALAAELDGGSLAIFRLAPQDYHRWHSLTRGTIESIKDIQGTYFTVNPCTINENLNVFTENRRMVMTLKSHKGFRYAVVPIGALLVGSIVLTHANEVGNDLEKGEEMGYFQYGGSTVIAVFPKDVVAWDKDLLQNSENSVETKVNMGERIGVFQ